MITLHNASLEIKTSSSISKNEFIPNTLSDTKIKDASKLINIRVQTPDFKVLNLDREKTHCRLYAKSNLTETQHKNTIRNGITKSKHMIYNDENYNPNISKDYTSKCLLELIDKEKEASRYLKAELQKTCLESRKEKAELQKRIDELIKVNSEYHKQLVKEKTHSKQINDDNNTLKTKLESISRQTKMIIDGIINIVEKVSNKDIEISKLREGIIEKLENANTITNGLSFNDELKKLKAKSKIKRSISKTERIPPLFYKTRINEANSKLKGDDCQSIHIEEFNTMKCSTNPLKGSEIFGPMLPAINLSSIINIPDIEDRTSLLKTIKNLCEEDEELELKGIAPSPERPSEILRICNGKSSMKELKELKARLIENKKRLALNSK